MRRRPEPIPEEIVALLSPFFPEVNLDKIRIWEGIPFYVRGNPIGYADREQIYFEPGAFRADTIEGLALLAHEIAHCRQYRALGPWRFRFRYLSYYLRNLLQGMSRKEAYLNVPFEIEAREVETEVYHALLRIQEKLYDSA